MKIFRILIATSFLLLLSGCDRGTMNPNYQCGMKADGQKVMGYNSQICSENSEYQSLYMTNPDFTVDLINDTNEAKTGIPALYKKMKHYQYTTSICLSSSKITNHHHRRCVVDDCSIPDLFCISNII